MSLRSTHPGSYLSDLGTILARSRSDTYEKGPGISDPTDSVRGSGLVILPCPRLPKGHTATAHSYLFGGVIRMSTLSRPFLTRVDPPPGVRTVLDPPDGTFTFRRLGM